VSLTNGMFHVNTVWGTLGTLLCKARNFFSVWSMEAQTTDQHPSLQFLSLGRLALW